MEQKKYKVQKNLTGLIPFYKSHPKFTFGAIIPLAIGLACLAVGTALTFTGVFSPLGAAMALTGVNIAFSSLTTFGLATAGFCGIVGVASTWVATLFILNVIKTINAFKRIFRFNADDINEKSGNINSAKKINDALSLNGTKSALHSKTPNSKKQKLIKEAEFDNQDTKNAISFTAVADNNKPKENIIASTSSPIKVSNILPQQPPSLETEHRKNPQGESKNNLENKSDIDSDDESFHSCTSSNEDHHNQALSSHSK